MANSFLFELGTEEIPAGMITPAEEKLRQNFLAVFRENDLEYESVKTYSTPRRLTAIVTGLGDKQLDKEELIPGPPRSAGIDQSGQPTKAAEGFARRFGAAAEDLEEIETEKGVYLALRRLKKGKAVPEILRESLPTVISSIDWPKNMYWRDSRFRFIRPLRWVVALWNESVVEFEFEGVCSGRQTRGHRFLGQKIFPIPSVEEYGSLLRKNFVVIDPEERKRVIIEGLARETGDQKLYPDEGLTEMVVHLNEYPSVMRGAFQPKFLEIPKEVLITVMRFHQKYFALTDQEGVLVPGFLTVINSNGDPEGNIRRGHEKVLQARLEDAAFFWNFDQKRSLKVRVQDLSNVLFQEKLGSYLEKTERIRKICGQLPGNPGLSDAAWICKADLTTEMVRELTELQGIMGGLYAEKEGAPVGVWKAVYEHYLPISQQDRLPETLNGALLSIADRIDTIVGCFCAGIIPKGSSDPFGIRRQAQGLVLILLERKLSLSLDNLVQLAGQGLVDKGFNDEIRLQILEFLQQRVENLLERKGFSHDVIRAVMSPGVTTVRDAFNRAHALTEILDHEDFVALAVAFKRIRNILSKNPPPENMVKIELFQEESEKTLHSDFEALKLSVKKHLERENYKIALGEIAGIRKSVDQFFDDVLVMDENLDIRGNRLALLQVISELFLSVADFSEIVRQGGQDD